VTADLASLAAPGVDGFDAAEAVSRGLHDAEPVPRRHKVRRCLVHWVLRWLMLVYGGVLVVASVVGRCLSHRRVAPGPRGLASFSEASRRAAMRHDTDAVTKRWDAILGNPA
jgi:hypothetical protein